MQLNVRKFFTVCTHLALESSKIIKNIHQTSSLKTFMKGVNDPVTEADYKVRSFIHKGLKQYWPTLTIVGQEDKDFEGKIDYDFKQLEHQIFSQNAFSIGKQKQILSNQIDINKLIVWIDPVDGTLSYTQGYLDQVTTLIGVSYQGKARLGIIGSHYKNISTGQKRQYQFNPRVFVGDSLNSQAFQISSNLHVKQILPRKFKQSCRICFSRSRMNPQSLKRMQHISNLITRIGGSGKKALQVIQNKADSFIYLGSGIGPWDVCASEALIKSVDGIQTKANGQILKYDNISKQLLQGGTVLSVDNEVQSYVIQKIKTYKS